jgi:glucokinase
MAAVLLGADLGGTRLRVAGVLADGTLATPMLAVPTGPGFGPEALGEALHALTGELLAQLPGRAPSAFGLGTAGVVNGGPLSQCDNLPLLNGVDVAAILRASVPCPSRLENDSRCFALAEARYGAGRGRRDVCGITLGTGVGCGVVIDGRLHRGASAQAGEVWKIPLRDRHLEHFVSGAGVGRGYAAAGGVAGLDAEQVAARARQGDEAAIRAWRGFGEDLAYLCASVAALLDPELIVLGGALAGAFDLFEPALRARLADTCAQLAPASLGDVAGVVGAAVLGLPAS